MGIHEIKIEYVMMDALYIGGRNYSAQLILLYMLEFDVILVMDWLMQYNVYIDFWK